ncbi:MAG: short-chain dehydrogenase [Verrucomicrobia subdivision 6 bacterium BACL9 MAG-120507-bin52]|jgi:NAD(P)-dependent dehydrogenase (short-subunit alcohol dehydrogenase family)|uniref:Short-chain dehydrogenase n=2 Tax=Verrucomicrobia subdivision 6 TaxID=134627 RepID=A0A0R2RKK4_9BACT|nr:MAG: short-chain dehydrogenase [Verrucomicrobia subdivision 6 bacterium BACL9 MAG-120507-bin52]
MTSHTEKPIAVVTGAGSGIGRATALQLASDGYDVRIFELSSEAAGETLVLLQKAGGTGVFQTVDVSNTESVRTAFAGLPRLDVLVNNAGIAHIGNVLNTTPEDLDRLYQINVRGAYHCLHFGIPIMLKNGGGSIVNLASIASKVGIPDRFAYSMSKGAVFSMTLSVARDFVDKGIRCNCVCPARVHTPFVDGFIAKNYPGQQAEMFAKLSAGQPIGRMGEPEEIATLIAFLCSNKAAFITGSAYDIDGGFTLLR